MSPDNGKQVCYVAGGFKPERRELEVGEFTDEFIHVKNGKEGERVPSAGWRRSQSQRQGKQTGGEPKRSQRAGARPPPR